MQLPMLGQQGDLQAAQNHYFWEVILTVWWFTSRRNLHCVLHLRANLIADLILFALAVA